MDLIYCFNAFGMSIDDVSTFEEVAKCWNMVTDVLIVFYKTNENYDLRFKQKIQSTVKPRFMGIPLFKKQLSIYIVFSPDF